MTKAIYASQLGKKIRQFKKERTQIQSHLAILDSMIAELTSEQQTISALLATTNDNIATLERAMELMKTPKNHLNQYSTEHYRYASYDRLFHTKINRLILLVMKSQPERLFKIYDLIPEMLNLDGQAETNPTELHYDAVRKVLDRLACKGFIHKEITTPKDVYWRLN